MNKNLNVDKEKFSRYSIDTMRGSSTELSMLNCSILVVAFFGRILGNLFRFVLGGLDHHGSSEGTGELRLAPYRRRRNKSKVFFSIDQSSRC